ncbi:MAG: glutamine-hydrolyzing carbamoyl-phosphate synthase small subunit [Candidatus Bilamarchaeum sp.]|jgi:carbamoyl-phosphate synthase small subunit
MKAALVLKDGTVLEGLGFGAKTKEIGELVFSTAMTGYEESLTDPSYAGQILVSTYPLIGNYGVSGKRRESDQIHPTGFVIRELSPDQEHRDSKESLDKFMKDYNRPGIYGIDTRFVVRHIREKGVMPAIIATYNDNIDTKKMLQDLEFDYSSVDFVSKVTTQKPKVFNKGGKKKVVLFDFGAKMGMVKELVSRNLEVHMLPSFSTTRDVKEIEPDGIMLSNGPGDPAILKDTHKMIRELEGYKPIFGVCLGNQLLAHAFGGDTYKLKFGHRGVNHAVLDIKKNRIHLTTQNHGFAVGKVPQGFEVTHINVNDKTIEGIANYNKQIFSVQYHPEATPGPNDSRYLFDDFVKMM